MEILLEGQQYKLNDSDLDTAVIFQQHLQLFHGANFTNSANLESFDQYMSEEVAYPDFSQVIALIIAD